VQRNLADYGRHLGIAYQLIDDVLDFQSDPETRGKNLGDDLAEGKPTLPLIYAIRTGNGDYNDLMREVIRDGGRDKLQDILGAIESAGGLEYTARLAQSEANAALESLAELPDSPYREALGTLVRFAVARKH